MVNFSHPPFTVRSRSSFMALASRVRNMNSAPQLRSLWRVAFTPSETDGDLKNFVSKTWIFSNYLTNKHMM